MLTGTKLLPINLVRQQELTRSCNMELVTVGLFMVMMMMMMMTMMSMTVMHGTVMLVHSLQNTIVTQQYLDLTQSAKPSVKSIHQ